MCELELEGSLLLRRAGSFFSITQVDKLYYPCCACPVNGKNFHVFFLNKLKFSKNKNLDY